MYANGNEYLFTYGTFRNIAVQDGLFGRHIAMKEATLEGYCVYCEEDGFFSLYEEEGKVTKGFLLEILPDEIWIADQWEEVPFYEREIKKVNTATGLIDAWVYMRTCNGSRTKIENMNQTTGLTHEQLMEEVHKFGIYKRTKTIPRGDCYLVANCEIVDRKQWETEKYNIIQTRIPQKDHIKFMDLCCNTLKQRKFEAEGTIYGNKYFNLPTHNMQIRLPGSIYFIRNKCEVNTILAFPAILVDINYLQEAFTKETLLLEDTSWTPFLKQLGLQYRDNLQMKYFVNQSSPILKPKLKNINSNLEWYYKKTENWYYKRLELHIENLISAISC